MSKKSPKLTKEQKLEKQQMEIWQDKLQRLQGFLDKEGIDLQVRHQVVPVPRRRE
jgi:hypothetical protein